MPHEKLPQEDEFWVGEGGEVYFNEAEFGPTELDECQIVDGLNEGARLRAENERLTAKLQAAESAREYKRSQLRDAEASIEHLTEACVKAKKDVDYALDCMRVLAKRTEKAEAECAELRADVHHLCKFNPRFADLMYDVKMRAVREARNG